MYEAVLAEEWRAKLRALTAIALTTLAALDTRKGEKACARLHYKEVIALCEELGARAEAQRIRTRLAELADPESRTTDSLS